jgi:phosphoribosyl 1,2-cyclic phosphate phosphodiesterase
MPGTRTFTFLGTGTSVGVPMLGCDCAVCRSPDPHNQRYRCAALVQTPRGRILIDTPPELRLQLLRARAGFVHAILFTHYHADHLFGLDDVRPFARHLGGPVPLYCTHDTERKIREAFAYAFTDEARTNSSLFVPKLTFHRITTDPFAVLGERVVPVPLLHGGFDVLGFRFDDVAYCTDVSGIPAGSWPRLEGLRVLVLDALRPHPHPGHFSIDQALEVIAKLKPRQAYLTHMTHEIDHETTNRRLPPGVELAYDGLSFQF